MTTGRMRWKWQSSSWNLSAEWSASISITRERKLNI
jgi:hypothetical protein